MSDDTATSASDDPKEQMRLALERKKQAQRDSGTGGRGKDQQAGRPDTHPHGGKREFRRKSG
jgi:hypothetical protein